jgi:hypothetical protein
MMIGSIDQISGFSTAIIAFGRAVLYHSILILCALRAQSIRIEKIGSTLLPQAKEYIAAA